MFKKLKISYLVLFLVCGAFVLASCAVKQKKTTETTDTSVTDTTTTVPTTTEVTPTTGSEPTTTVTPTVTVTGVATTYSVYHYLEYLDKEGYYLESLSQLPGTSNQLTNATPNSYEGFTAQDFDQAIIADDGSTEIKIYYNRARFNVTLNETTKGTIIGAGEYKEGQTVTCTQEANKGYEFAGWYINNQLVCQTGDYSFVIDKDVNIEARFNATKVEYTVYHYKQNVNNDEYTLVTEDTQTIEGYSFDTTNAEALDYYGFIVKEFEQKEISPDGDTVINIYYDRVKSSIIISNVNPTFGSITGAGVFKYGESVTIIATPITGYEFDGWYVNGSSYSTDAKFIFAMPATNLSLTAKFKLKVMEYKVFHYKETLTGDYISSGDTDTLSGEAFSQTNAQAKTYEGFTAKEFEQKEIDPENLTVINIYYDRITKNVTVTNNNTERGTVTGAGTYKYGSSVKLTATASDGFEFDGWYVDNQCINTSPEYTVVVTTSDISVEVRFKYKIVNYTVKHYLENVNDSNYASTPEETETLSGSVYSYTEAVAKTYTGFNALAITQQQINLDGSTVVNVYYKRITYTLTVSVAEAGKGTATGGGTYKYGQTAVLNATANDGYEFAGWATSKYGSPIYSLNRFTVIVNANASYYATFKAATYNISLVTTGISSDNIDITGTKVNGKYAYNNQYTLTVVYTGNDIVAIEFDDEAMVCTKEYKFTMPAKAVTIKITVAPAIRNENKVLYGSYPQSRIDDTTLKSSLASTLGTQRPTSSVLNGWNYYSYYSSGSTSTKYMFYKDITYKNEKYRAVYFVQYRPYDVQTASSTSTSISFQDDNNYLINTVYYFKFEAVSWSIIKENEDNTVVILSDLIIDTKEIYVTRDTNKINHNQTYTGYGYANSYEYSNVRYYINNQFAGTLLSSTQLNYITSTTVDNSPESTETSSNNYAYDCNNTNDGLFLLSYHEAATYLTDETRKSSGTAYAICQGFNPSNPFYWLRSPSRYNGYSTVAVNANYSSYGSYEVTASNGGIRPACTISL